MAVDVGLFVSLLFVVVVEIGGIARSLDLERISEEKLPPFFVGLFFLLDTSSRQRRVSIPQLGRFNFLHGANLAIVFIGFGLVTSTTSGTTGLLIALVTFVVWALIPLLEVDEYEAILVDGYRPVSYYHHVFLVSVAALFVSGYDALWATALAPLLPAVLRPVVLGGVSVALYYAMLFGFLAHLERELDRVDSPRLPDALTRTDVESG